MQTDVVTSIISISIACISMVIAFISLYFAIRQHNKANIDFFFDNTKGILSFINDAYEILDSGSFRDMKGIIATEEELLTGFNRLYYYGVANRYKYLEEFGCIKCDDVEEKKKCFAYRFLKIENNYMNFRKKHLNDSVTIEDKEKLYNYIKVFKNMFYLSSKYCMKLFLNKHPRNSVVQKYYRSLESAYYLKRKGINYA